MLSPALVLILPLLFPAQSTVHAQATDVTSCLPAYSWMMNSIGQNPCFVTAWLFVPCYGTGSANQVDALQTGEEYIGPSDPAYSTTCRCNTIVYSLLAACAICQTSAARIQTWPVYSTNCTKSYNESYPNTIPVGTSVPEWAFLDVIGNDGNFDVNAAKSVAAQQLPDVTATTDTVTSSTSTLSSQTSASSTTPTSDSMGTSSQNLTPTSSPVTERSRKNMGAIIGGAVGAVVGVLLVGALVFCILRYRRHRRRDQGVANAVSTTEVRELPPDSIAPSYYVPTLQSDAGSAIVGFYDPNDPRTYPAPLDPAKGYTGRPQVMS